MDDLLLGDLPSLAAARGRDRVAASLDGDLLTFGQLAGRTDIVVRALASRGVGKGDRIVWRGDRSLSAIPLWFALSRLGAVCVPLNPGLTPDEASAMLDLADPRLVVDEADVDALLTDRHTSGVTPPAIREVDPHVIFFTSGSSGRPKGAVLSHRATRLRTLIDATLWPGPPVVCMFPQFHMAGWFGPMTAWTSGSESVYVGEATAEALLTGVHRRRAGRLYAIPAVWRRILDADRTGYDLTCLTQCDTGTSAVTADLLAAIAVTFPGAQTTITYGSTEAGGVCRLWPGDVHDRPGSVGLPAPGCEVRVDADSGELLVRSAFLFSGYFRDPEQTAAALVDGWYHTGDLAEQDPDGYITITGRAGDVIRTGGEGVIPVEVDAVLQAMPQVADAAVAGVPDETWGELVTAFVVLRPGEEVSLEDIRSFCADKLATFKHPRRLVILDALPRTGATGQIQRRRLVEAARRHP